MNVMRRLVCGSVPAKEADRVPAKTDRPALRWAIVALSNRRERSYAYGYGPPYARFHAHHRSKADAIAEIRAILPRTDERTLLLLWDEWSESWVDFEP